MAAKSQNFLPYVREIHIDIDDIGPIGAVGLEEFVPDHDAVFVAKIVEVFAGALADPIANHVVIGFFVHPDLGIEACRGTRFIASSMPQSPPLHMTGTPLTEIVRFGEPGTS